VARGSSNVEEGQMNRWIERFARWAGWIEPLPVKCVCGKDPEMRRDIQGRWSYYCAYRHGGCGLFGGIMRSKEEARVSWNVRVEKERERTVNHKQEG
jgi:hypothetical protein